MLSLVITGTTALAVTIWQTPQQSYFEWTDLPFPADEYVTRRARLTHQLQELGGGLFLTPSGSGTSHGETFRPLDDFLYLTGLELPDAIFALDATSGQGTVFVARRDPRFESPSRRNDFPGRPLADDPSLSQRTGLSVRPFDELAGFLSHAQTNGTTVRINIGRRGDVTRPKQEPVEDLPSRVRPGKLAFECRRF